MSWKLNRLHQPPLRPAQSDEEFQLHRAALEWSLADPIVIQSRDDIQSRDNWRGQLEPYLHQVQNLVTFCRRLPVTLLADDVGLGKTISAGLILSELMVRRRVTRALVICPKILGPQWADELWSKFGVSACFATGETLSDQLEKGAPVVVTTYESATNRLVDAKSLSFEMLILDEAHKLRNLHGTKSTPKMATVIRGALERRLFKYVLMLTATPIQNRVWDLYSLIDCLAVAKGHQNPLGPPDLFRERFVQAGSDGRKLVANRAEDFRRILRQYIVRTRRGDAQLVFPTREVRLLRVPLTDPEKTLSRIVASHIQTLNAFQQTSLAQALMSSPAALATQMENMAAANPSLRSATIQARNLAAACVEPAKLARLIAYCKELRTGKPDWRVVVFTLRKETQNMIGEALARHGISVGYIRGGQPRDNQRAIDGYRDAPPRVHALISTDAGAEGINLQAGNVLVNYDLPWNPMVVEQRIGRIQRLNSDHRNVVILNLVAAGTVEESVVGRLVEKLQSVAESVGDIESILETPGFGGDEEHFEKVIRDLVVKSLLGQNVEHARQQELASIENARRVIERERSEMDRTLGGLDELKTSGPTMPRLSRVLPSVAAADFVLRAKRAGGATVKEASPGIFAVNQTGRDTELITFDEATAAAGDTRAIFMGKLRLYAPGKRDFERLVQHWVDRCGHRLWDADSSKAAERLARDWCNTVPEAAYLGNEVREQEPWFQGRVVVRTKASNGVDSFEKLIAVEYGADHHDPLPNEPDVAAPVAEEVTGSEYFNDYEDGVVRHVEDDIEISEFHKFYEARRAEELARAGSDARLRHKVQEDFGVAVHAEVVGIEGVKYDEVRLSVRFTVRGEGNYAAELRAVPASGQILEDPPRSRCEQTGVTVPTNCLERCGLTRKSVLRHLLTTTATGRRVIRDRVVTCHVTGRIAAEDEVMRSPVSGAVALRRLFVRCERTQEYLLEDETGTSAVSGAVVRADLLRPSEKPPHRLGLADELAACAISGRMLLTDELETSSVSGRAGDRDLIGRSAVSGRLALPEELVACAVSKATLLPEEAGTCSVTSLVVDARLLTASKVSGKPALATQIVKCQVTGACALPGELNQCEVTGQSVLPQELTTCAVTQKRAVRSVMARCEVSNVWLLRSEARQSDLSGKLVDRRLLVNSEKPPGRLGLSDEITRCDSTGRRLLKDEVGASAVSGGTYDRDLLLRSASSGKYALASELVICQETGVELLPCETAVCEISGRTVDARITGKCQLTGRVALSNLLETCSETGLKVFPSELVECEQTGRRVVPDRLGVCSVTKRCVLNSLLVRCEHSGSLALGSEVATSDLSGRRVLKSLMVRSELPPGRFGLSEEISTCEASGRKLLTDELGESTVSGRRVGRDLLVESVSSGRLALASEMVICEESGVALLPCETIKCGVTGKVVDARLTSESQLSGRAALSVLLEPCSETGIMAFPSELATCEQTGRRVVPGRIGACSVTGRRVLDSLLKKCDHSGAVALEAEVAASDLSGRLVLKTYLVHSELPPFRSGLLEESSTCEVSGRRLLLDELAVSAVSGRRVGKDLLSPSSLSGRLALSSELVACQETGAALLPDESVACGVTGKIVDARLVTRSELSGRVGLTGLMVACGETGLKVLPSELVACEQTGRRVVPGQLGRCSVTGRRVLKSLLVRCEHSGAVALESELAKSDLSGRFVLKSLLVRSEMPPGRVGLSEETSTCEASGRKLLRDELGESAVSGRRVGRDLLLPSAISGKTATADELVTCQESNVRLLPSECATCSETGKIVDMGRLRTHDLTGRLVLARLTGRCQRTNTRVLLRELEKCGLTGQTVLSAELESCAITGTRALRDRMTKSQVSGRYAVPDRAFTSAVSGRVGLSDEGEVCPWLGQTVLRKETDRCSLTGLRVAKNSLNAANQLSDLAALLDGQMQHATKPKDFIPVLKTLDRDFEGVTAVEAVRGPSGVYAVRAEVRTKGWFRERVTFIGVLVKFGQKPGILGDGVQGYRDDEGDFVIEHELQFSR